MGLYLKMKIAFAATAVALLSMAGGAVFAHTYDPVPTLPAMLGVAVLIATVGRRAASVYWVKHWLGSENPDTDETRSYGATTRGRQLAPKLLRLVHKATAPVTIMVVGDEHQPGRDGRCRWTEALHKAAEAGASVLLYVQREAESDEIERAHALTHAHPHCRAIRLGRTDWDRFEIMCPVLAWAGERENPEDALFWLEATRGLGERKTSVEYRDGRNLRTKEPDMLESFAKSIEEARAREPNRRSPRAPEQSSV